MGKPDGGADPGSADTRRAERVLGERAFVSDPSPCSTGTGSGSASSRELPKRRRHLGELDHREPRRGGPRPRDAGDGGVGTRARGARPASPQGRGRRARRRHRGVRRARRPRRRPPARRQAAGPGQPRIVSRAQWGADESLRLGACPAGPRLRGPADRGRPPHRRRERLLAGGVPGDHAWAVRLVHPGSRLLRHGLQLPRSTGTGRSSRVGTAASTRAWSAPTRPDFNTGTFGVALMGAYGSVAPSGSSVEALGRPPGLEDVGPPDEPVRRRWPTAAGW